MAMTREEFERLKEAEKEHLRKLRELKQTLREAERKRSISQVVGDMATESQDLLDTNTRLADELLFQTARSEARLAMALEEELEKARKEEEALRARRLIEEMKSGLLAGGETTEPVDKKEDKASDKVEKDPLPAAGQPPEKTIGRMR